MNNETGKLSFDKLFLLSGIYALFYTFCLYRNRMGLTFPVFVLGTAGLFLYYLRLTGRALKTGSALYLGGILLLGLNVLTRVLFFCSFLCFSCTICTMIRPGMCQNISFPCVAASSHR